MEVAGNDCCYLNSETKRLVGSPVHVMLKSDAFSMLESMDASRIRTLILLTTFPIKLKKKELSVILKFKYLRVLKLSDRSLSKLCGSIGNLKHLRYLNLSICRGLGRLSKSIGNHICLQTLLLYHCDDVEFSTKDISKLINLRHFHIEHLKAPKLGVGEQYNSVIFSNLFFWLTNIVQISLSHCHGLKYLPPMEHLPFLKSLSIHHLYELEVIYYEEPLLSESFFPSLKKLKFVSCDKLRGWRRMKDDINDDDNSLQPYNLSFPHLSELEIYLCSRLTHMPTFPKLDKTLTFTFSRVEALEPTLNMVGSKYSIEFPPLSMLKHLGIGGFNLNVKKFPKDWMQNLTSLKYLDFKKLKNIKILETQIWFKDSNYLPFLDCIDLEALPDWICNLSSLHHIYIAYCECLASMPEGIPRLAKLQTLEIVCCPLLIEECETQTSATWPKIAHIPNIFLHRYDYY
jgi:hypothetical protein